MKSNIRNREREREAFMMMTMFHILQMNKSIVSPIIVILLYTYTYSLCKLGMLSHETYTENENHFFSISILFL